MKTIYLFFIISLLTAIQLFSPQKSYSQSYCKPSFTGCSGGDSIYFFQFGSYTRNSGCSGGYDTSQVKNSVLTVYRGKTYNLRILTPKAESLAAWIDYNRNGSYEDTAELVAADFNNTYDSINTSVTIPINVTPQVTRMRIMAVNSGASSLDYNKDCNSWSYGGEAEDYKITIAAYTNDVGILALNSPQALSCPSSSERVQIILTNYGTNSQTNIPFVFKYGSTTISSTYKRTLAATKSDTFTVGFFNASTSGNYTFSVFANLSGDADHSNDTITKTVLISQPTAPLVKNYTNCGPASGAYISGASSTTGATTYWFKNATTDTLYAKGDSIQIPYLSSGSATYYAESRLPNVGSLTKGNYNSARANYGNFFDVFAKQTIMVDSFDVNSGASGTTDKITVYYRLGTYYGAERNSSDWISLGTVTVNGKGSTNPSRLPLPNSVTLQVGNTYGFYIVPTSYQLLYDITGNTGAYKSNNEITIRAGASTATAFASGGTAVSPNRDWQGTIYYHYPSCNSVRKSASLTINQSPSGATFFKSSPFQGQYNAGNSLNPDNICLGDTNVYQLSAPKGLSNSDFGKKWTMSSLTFSTLGGTKISDTLTKIPSSSKNLTFSFYPKKYTDSIFVLRFKIKIIGSICDSQIERYIHIRAKPIAAFSYKNTCTGLNPAFKDSSYILSGSKISSWTWDFGDASTSASQSPAHVFAKAGSYKVSLKVAIPEGCSNTISKSVTQYPLPVSKWGALPVCKNSPMNFLDSSSITSGSISGWKWTFGDPSSGSANTSIKQNPFYTYAKSGPYNVKLAITSNFGCKDSLTRKVRIMPTPVASVIYNPVCVGTTLYFGNSSTDSSVGTAYLWNFGDGSALSKAGSPAHVYTKNGTYRISLVATSKSGCMDSVVQFITPYPKPGPALFVSNGCKGSPVNIGDSSHSAKPSSYTWTYGDGGSDQTSTPKFSHVYAKSGTYKVSLLLSNNYSCTDTQSKSLTIIDHASPGFSATSVCQGKPTVFTNATSGTGPFSYLWYFGDNSAVNKTSDPTHTYTKSGSYNVKLAAVNVYGCADTITKSVTVNAIPVIKPWIRKQNRYTVTFVPQDSTIGSFTWYFGTNTNDSSSKKQPIFTYPVGDAIYVVRLVVKSVQGCTNSYVDTIKTGKYNGIAEIGNIFEDVSVFPNPFENKTNISYTLKNKSRVVLCVFDVQGKEIARLKDGYFNTGIYNDLFDAGMYNNVQGVYILKLSVNDQYFTTKLITTK